MNRTMLEAERFTAELNEFVATGFVLVGRIGNLDGAELRVRVDGEVERIDHDAWVQLIGVRQTQEALVRSDVEGEGRRLVVLAHDKDVPASLCVQCAGLYVGGRFRVSEVLTDEEAIRARWEGSELKSCWVSAPAGKCC